MQLIYKVAQLSNMLKYAYFASAISGILWLFAVKYNQGTPFFIVDNIL